MLNEDVERVYLVDLENVGWGALIDANQLGPNEVVYIFVTDMVGDLPVNVSRSLFSSEATIELVEAENGYSNALDFQISCFLGIKLMEYEDAEFIISADKGYRALKSFVEPTRLIISETFKKKRNYSRFDNYWRSKRKKHELSAEIERKLRLDDSVHLKNYQSVAGHLVSMMYQSKNLKDFKKKVRRVDSNEHYQERMISACLQYFN